MDFHRMLSIFWTWHKEQSVGLFHTWVDCFMLLKLGAAEVSPTGMLHVLGHVTGINSATTTCQPRPANHDLCFLGFWTNQKEIFNAPICIKIKKLESYWYGNSYFINTFGIYTISSSCKLLHWIIWKHYYDVKYTKFYICTFSILLIRICSSTQCVWYTIDVKVSHHVIHNVILGCPFRKR